MNGTARPLYAVLVLALVVGAAARGANLDRKVFFQDEAYAALRITGHTQAAYLRSFDGRVRAVASVLAFQRLDAGSSPRATLASIAREEPQRGPLYYALAAVWVRAAGTSVNGFRSLSVLIGLLAIVAAYAFGRAFFGKVPPAAILAALVAVSPFHIRYAQQAREYGLFSVAVFASSACLVVALRRGRAGWVAYAFACAAGLATSPFYALVVVSHAAYVAYEAFVMHTAARTPRTADTSKLERRRARQTIAGYAAATGAAVAVMLPWFAYASRSAGTVAEQTDWAASPYPAGFILTKWIFNIGATFFDYEFADVRFGAVLLVLLPIVAWAVLRALRHARPAAALVCALAVPTLFAFGAKDALGHSHFATIPRYLTPLWIALEIAVTAGIYDAFGAASTLTRRTGAAALGILLAGGLWSAVGDSRAAMWWDNNDNEPTIAVARVVNAAPQPLVATSNVAITLSLVHYLRDAVRMQLYPRDAPPADLEGKRARGRATYFLFLPSRSERAALDRRSVSLANVSPQDDTIVRGFHAALQRARPGPRSRSLSELSGPNALWKIATSRDGQ